MDMHACIPLNLQTKLKMHQKQRVFDLSHVVNKVEDMRQIVRTFPFVHFFLFFLSLHCLRLLLELLLRESYRSV